MESASFKTNMDKESISTLFTALRGGIIRDLKRENTTVQFRVELPELARVEEDGFGFFYATLSGCSKFYLQPFRNESTVLDSLQQIERLEVEIHEGTIKGEIVKVFCAHKGVSNGAVLTIRASSFKVWNQNFDERNAGDLVRLRDGDLPG